MPVRWTLLVVFFVCLSALSHRPASADELQHRAFLGIGFRSLTAAEADSLHLKGGLFVNRVLPGTPAGQAGLREGDVIESVDGAPVAGEGELRATLRRRYAGDEVTLAVVSGGEERTLRFVAAAAPEARADSLTTEYASFVSDGLRLRAVITSPLGSEGKRLPALLMISALDSPQFVATSAHSGTRSVAHRAARAGFRVMCFELRGAGDSEGEDYHNTDFNTEVGDNAAAFDYLAGRPDVDPKRVFIYGHSTGGMEGAVVAGSRPAAGFIAACTLGRTFLERMAETVRLQAKLGGGSEADIDRAVNDHLEFACAIMRGATASDLRADSAFAGRFNAAGRIMDDRTIDFWRQQLLLPLGETYSRIRCPVLVLYAGSDFLTQLACHERIRDVLVGAGNPDVTLEVIPGTDHAYSQAKAVCESFEHYRTRDFRENPAPVTAIVEWLRAHQAP